MASKGGSCYAVATLNWEGGVSVSSTIARFQVQAIQWTSWSNHSRLLPGLELEMQSLVEVPAIPYKYSVLGDWSKVPPSPHALTG